MKSFLFLLFITIGFSAQAGVFCGEFYKVGSISGGVRTSDGEEYQISGTSNLRRLMLSNYADGDAVCMHYTGNVSRYISNTVHIGRRGARPNYINVYRVEPDPNAESQDRDSESDAESEESE